MRSLFLEHVLTGVRWAAWGTFAALAAAVIRSDWREKRISHRPLAAGVVFCLLGYSALAVHSILGAGGAVSSYFTPAFYRDAAAHAAVLSAAGLALWYLAVWPAGDAKLFLVLALLYPLMSPGRSLRPSRLWLDVLVNIFIPASAAVFLQALRYAWSTRLRHMTIFVRQMDAKMKLHYALDLGRRSAAGALGEARDQARRAWDAARAQPLRTLRDGGRLAASALALSLLSCAVQSLVQQPLSRTALCYIACFLWQRVVKYIGPLSAATLMIAAPAWMLARASPELWRSLWTNLREISAFGLFLYFGMRWIRAAMAGQVGALAWPAIALLPALAGLVGGLGIFGGMTGRDWTFTAAAWATMGAFFGVSLVLVRLRETEDRSHVRPEDLKPYMVIHPDFLERLPADDPSGAFERWYADGLTRDQLESVKRWCRDQGVDMVPLAKTMPFAHWIVLGYLFTWLANGSVLGWLAG